MILLKNAVGTANLRPPLGYKSWLDFWEKKSGKHFMPYRWYDCPICGQKILREEIDGCHVQTVSNPKQLYILPACDACNHEERHFWADENLLVPVP